MYQSIDNVTAFWYKKQHNPLKFGDDDKIDDDYKWEKLKWSMIISKYDL